MEDQSKITTLAESNTQILIRIETTHNIGGRPVKGVRHEWWTDKDAMTRGDYTTTDSSGEMLIHCSGFAGVDEAELIEIFRREVGQ